MWAVMVPIMVVGCGVAVGPVAYRSFSTSRGTERSRLPHLQLMSQSATKPADDADLQMTCAPCGYKLTASCRDELFGKLALHESQWHGIPRLAPVVVQQERWFPPRVGSQDVA
jgi:hypothetical protein